MKTFKQHLSESLSSSYPIRMIRSDAAFHEFAFSDPDNHYHVVMMRHRPTGTDYVLTVDFMAQHVLTRDGQKIPLNFETMPSGKAHNALKVYSTIGQQIKKYLVTNPVDRIYFSAASSRTLKVYSMLAKRIAKELGGTFDIDGGTFEIELK